MIDHSYFLATVKLFKAAGLYIPFKYLEDLLEHKSDAARDREAVKLFKESYMKAFENLTEALINQPENADEILKRLKELYDLREIILPFITRIS